MHTRPREFRWWLPGIAVVAAVLAGLASVPVAGAGRRVVGVVLAATGASTANAPLIEGSTLTSGDFVHTESGGSARLRLGRATQVSLGTGTAVWFRSEVNRVIVEMSAGATMTRETGKDPIVVETPGFRVEPAGQGRVVYIVAMLPDKTDVAARAGKLVITDVASAQQTFVSEGEVAEIMGVPTPAAGRSPQEQESGKAAPGKTAGQESSPTKTKSKNNHAIIILAGAAAAAAGIGLAVAAGGGGGAPPSSPAHP